LPRKVKYTRDEVIKAAVSVVEENGLHSLTARSVAVKLGSSTAPVYHHFATMDELALGMIRQTQGALLEYTSRPYTDQVLLNMGTGIALFACEHRLLYRALMLEGDSYSDVVLEFLGILESELTNDSRYAPLSDSERRMLVRKMWTFAHGLASLICVGLIKDCDRDYITKTLLDAGADVVGATPAKRKNDVRSD